MRVDLPLDKKTVENQDWATGPPGRGAVAGCGPRAAGLLLAKPQRKRELLIGLLLGDLFSYSHDQILFDDRLQYCVRGIRYTCHI